MTIINPRKEYWPGVTIVETMVSYEREMALVAIEIGLPGISSATSVLSPEHCHPVHRHFLWENITFYDAVNMIHDVITTANPFPHTAKLMFVGVRNNETQQIKR